MKRYWEIKHIFSMPSEHISEAKWQTTMHEICLEIEFVHTEHVGYTSSHVLSKSAKTVRWTKKSSEFLAQNSNIIKNSISYVISTENSKFSYFAAKFLDFCFSPKCCFRFSAI